jgi:hypothetical protein
VSGYDFISVFSQLVQGAALAPPVSKRDPMDFAAELIKTAGELQAFQLLSRLKQNPLFSVGSSIELEEKIGREALVTSVVLEQNATVLSIFKHAEVPVIIAGDPLARAELSVEERKARPLRANEFWVGFRHWTDAIRALNDRGFEIQGLENQPQNCVQLRLRKSPPVILFHSMNPASTAEQIQRTWSRIEFGKVSGLPLTAGTLSPFDRLLRIALNSQRSWGNPTLGHLDLWAFFDADQIIRHHEVHWDEWIWELAEQRAIASGWFLLQSLHQSWKTPIPGQVLKEMRSLVYPRRRWSLEPWLGVEAWLSHQLFPQQSVRPNSRASLRDGLFERVVSFINIKRSPVEPSAVHTPTILLDESRDSTRPNVPSPRP